MSVFNSLGYVYKQVKDKVPEPKEKIVEPVKTVTAIIGDVLDKVSKKTSKKASKKSEPKKV